MGERTNLLTEAIQDVFGYSDRAPIDVALTLKKLGDADERKIEKIRAILTLVRNCLPYDKSQGESYFYNIAGIRVSPNDYAFMGEIGTGLESRVYLLEAKDPEKESLVLKVNRLVERNPFALRKKVAEIKQVYQYNLEKFESIHGLIPEMTWRLGRDVRTFPFVKGRPVILAFQAFVGRNLKDACSDDPEVQSEVTELCRNNPALADQVRQFVEIEKSIIEGDGVSMDLVGKNNLVITHSNRGEEKLLAIDPLYNVEEKSWGEKYEEGMGICKQKLEILESHLK